MNIRVILTLLVVTAVMISEVVMADESKQRTEVKLGFEGWIAQGDKIERIQRVDGGVVIKITGNVLLWTRNKDGKAIVASMDSLESMDSTFILKGYPVLAQGEGMMIPSPNIDPEFALTVKDGKITGQHNGEISGTLGEAGRARVAALEKMISMRKEAVQTKLAEIIKEAQP